MWPKPPSRHEWLLVGAFLFVSVLPGWGLVGSVDGAEAVLTREMHYSEDFGERAQAAFVEMIQDLAKHGCKTARAYAYSKEEEPGVLVLGVKCLEWYELAKQ